MIQTGRERLANPGWGAITVENARAAVPHLGFVIVTAMFGIVRLPVLRTEITRRVRCASRCVPGKVARTTATRKLGLAVAAAVAPAPAPAPPHALIISPDAIAVSATPQARAWLGTVRPRVTHRLRPGRRTAPATYQLRSSTRRRSAVAAEQTRMSRGALVMSGAVP